MRKSAVSASRWGEGASFPSASKISSIGKCTLSPESVNPWIYAFFTATGLTVSLVTLRLMRGSPATKGPSTLSLLPALIPGALVGAKLPVLLSYGVSREMLWTGKSYYGALLGGFIAMNLYKAAKGIHGRFGDRFVVPLCLGAAVGKTGCFFAGCCGGIAANLPFGVANRMGILAYPVQLYEAGFQALMAAMFLLLLWKRRWMGSHFILYILLYSFFRFSVEFVRTEPRVLAGLTVYQWMSILSVPVFTTILAWRLKDETTGA